jgi:gamma-glutamylcyclotransferase (GGCT)/AIG2-like uncharacterized protein YtfP
MGGQSVWHATLFGAWILLSPIRMNLFTYGSLMFPEVWQRVAGESFATRIVTLHGFAAWNVRGESYPGLAPAEGESTRGVLHLEVSPAAAARLDSFEGAFYERTEIVVTTPDGSLINAFAYVVAPRHRAELEMIRWDAEEFRQHHLPHFLGPKPTG